jgi:hypothetical protein
MATEVAETLKTKAISLKLGCIVLIPYNFCKGTGLGETMPAIDCVPFRIGQVRSPCNRGIVDGWHWRPMVLNHAVPIT